MTIDDDTLAGADGEELAWEDLLKENESTGKGEGKENEAISLHIKSGSVTSVSVLRDSARRYLGPLVARPWMRRSMSLGRWLWLAVPRYGVIMFKLR